jgi:hypothetical protein
MLSAILLLTFFFVDKKACLPGRVREIPKKEKKKAKGGLDDFLKRKLR